jgi:hypothetical protein
MKMRIQLWQRDKPIELPIYNEFVVVDNNAQLSAAINQVIMTISEQRGLESLVQDDLSIHINRVS